MLYHLDTIPVIDAIRQETACPLCFLREKIEAQDVERALGGSVMEPDMRVKVNEKGFCPRHQQMLYEQKNRLGHALLMQSRLAAVRDKVLPALEDAVRNVRPGLLKGDKSGRVQSAAGKIAAQTDGCVICDSVCEHTKRYMYTLLHLYKTDASFAKAFAQSRGVCLRDLPPLLSMAEETLSGDALRSFIQVLYDTQKREMEQLQSDLDGFCVKFDYRNHDKPWGTCRGALERTVNRLRGKTLKEET